MQLNKRTLKIAGIAAGALLLILLAIPIFIDVNSFRPKIESELTNATGRQVTLGKLSLSILSGTVGVKDVSIADDPAFSKSPFITAKSLEVGVEVMPLIFSKQLNVTGIELEEPNITLLKSGTNWNFSSLGGESAKKTSEPSKEGGSQALSIAKLEIRDGKVSVGTVNSATKPQVYDKVNIEMKDFSATTQFPFKVTANLPGGGSADISGKAGPINPQNSAKTPFEASIKVKDLDIATSGFVDAASGFGGLADLDGTLNSNGSQAKGAGVVKCEKLKLSPKGSPAPKAVEIKYAVDSNLDSQSGNITQGDIALGKATAQLTGGFQTQGEAKVVNLKLNAPGMPVDELEAMLPALGITLPSGSQLKGGTLAANLAISGALDKLVITGPVRLSNTKLAGFDMGAKLGALSAFTGKTASNPDTTIQNASLNASVSPEMTKADAINVTIPSLGTVTGAGTISPAGALNFNMNADLQGGVAGGLTQKAGLGGGGGGNGIAFTIEGTTANPKFVPNVGNIAASAAKGALQKTVTNQTGGVTSGLGGLLGGKKKK